VAGHTSRKKNQATTKQNKVKHAMIKQGREYGDSLKSSKKRPDDEQTVLISNFWFMVQRNGTTNPIMAPTGHQTPKKGNA